MRRLLLTAALGVLIQAAPTSAVAGEREDERAAQAHVDQGRDHFRAGRYDEAILEFRKAQRIVTSPALIWNMARAFEELGDVRNAVHYFENLVTEWPDDESADEAQMRLDRLRPKAPGSLRVDCAGARGGRVVLDEDEEGARECDAKFPSVTPGVHAVRVEAPGREPWLGNVRVAPGKRATVQAVWARGRKSRRTPRVSAGQPTNWTAIAATGAAAAILTGALVLHLRSNAAIDDYNALHDRDSVTEAEIRDQAAVANDSATMAASLLGVGLLAGLGAAWVWTW